ncbi:MAG: entericidin A/B family lipoprotein [Desulfuromonadaceae bacterium]
MIRLILMFLVLAIFLGGCETTKGVGKDVQKAGEWIEEKASK